MLKSNSKQVKENIRKYIIDNYDIEDYSGGEISNSNDFQIVKKQIMDIFTEEVGKRQGVNYNSFRYWMQGLPSIIDACYYYNRSAVKDLGDILEESEEERNKYTEEQAEERLTQLIYKELNV